MAIVKVSELYSDYPVKVDSLDFENMLGINLLDEIKGSSDARVSAFLDTTHRIVYDFLIYNTGDKELKDSLIKVFPEQLTKPLKRALLTQGQYLLANSNIELFNGVIKTIGGVDYKETAETIIKIIAPSIINILGATRPCVLYAGG